jgi:multicomponent Na+:H+ antiporter subunit D
MDVISELSTNWNIIFSGLFVILGIAIFIYGRAIPQGGRNWQLAAGLVFVLALIGVLVGPGLIKTLLIDAAAFAAVALVFLDANPAIRHAAKIYLVMVTAAVVCLLLAENLAGESIPQYPVDRLVVWLLLLGFALKLALLPVYFWLPAVAENAAPMSLALIVSVVDMATFTELVHLREVMPWAFSAHQGIWLAVALLSMIGGALLALGQKNIRRMLAFSTIDDMGYLLLGVVAGSEIGLTGALLGALAHALFKVILFGAVGIAEHCLEHPLTLADRGLAGRFSLSGFAYIVASLGMIGVPPLIGFAGRWRLYMAGIEIGGIWMGSVMAAATVLALFYYVRSIHRVWMGPDDNTAKSFSEPRLAGIVLIALVSIALALGLIPAWLLAL